MNGTHTILGFVVVIAVTTLTAACGGASHTTRKPAQRPNPQFAQNATSSPETGTAPSFAASSPTASLGQGGAGQQELIALAHLVYPPDGKNTCEQGNPTSPAYSDFNTCPFTPALVARLVTAQQARARSTAGGGSVLCHCQSAPSGYKTTKASGAADGGTVTVVATYCCGNDLTFTLMMATDHGMLQVSDIIVQGPSCGGYPEQIDATRCSLAHP